MIQKKICLLGAFSVGKTSLIKRYVSSLYSDKYLTTVGVKVDKKQLEVDQQAVTLMIWDLAGEDDYTEIKPAYLRGSAGCIIVIDGTRLNTYSTALGIYQTVRECLQDVPVVFALNKCDLKPRWLLDNSHIETLQALKTPVFLTSAKEGTEVETIFQTLAQQMLKTREV